MKKRLLLSAGGLVGALLAPAQAQSQEIARVISSTPVIAQVAVPRQICTQAPIAVPRQGSGAGSVIGAVAGGILGSTIGHGTGRAAATALGVLGGAVVGNHVEAGSSGYAAPHCRTETSYENRTVSYDVSYEWGGKTYRAQMPYDPGQTLAVQVVPAAAAAVNAAPVSGMFPAAPLPSAQGIPILRSYEVWPHPAPAAGAIPGPDDPVVPATASTPYPAPTAYPAPVPAVPGPIYDAAPVYPVYPVYGVRPYPPPVGMSLHFGYSRGHGRHHRGHRHWR